MWERFIKTIGFPFLIITWILIIVIGSLLTIVLYPFMLTYWIVTAHYIPLYEILVLNQVSRLFEFMDKLYA